MHRALPSRSIERRPEDRPRELLDAALVVFAERGYRNARIDDVAEAAGVTKGAVYHHFENKEELLVRAIGHHVDRAFGELEETVRVAGGPASSRIRLLLRQAFGGGDATRRRVLGVLLQGIRHDVPEAHRRWLAGGPLKAWQLLATLIEDGKAAGEFRADVDAEVAARLTISGLMTQLAWQPLDVEIAGVGIDEARLVEAATELLLRGLSAG